jgi:aerobic C4-dicarboxylate transport protein
MAGAAALEGPDKAKQAMWRGLGFQVIVGMLLGAVVGLLWPEIGASLKILGDIFLRLVQTIVAPLVFLTVTVGILGTGDSKGLGKVGLVGLLYFQIGTTAALAWGMWTGMVTGVGRGIDLREPVTEAAAAGAEAAREAAARAPLSWSNFLLDIVPDNLIGAFTRGEVLQVLVVALIFAFAVKALKPEQRDPIEKGLNLLAQAMFKFTHLIMYVAPVGAFGATAFAVATNGSAVLVALGYWIAVYWASQVVFILLALGGVCLLFGLNLFSILNHIRNEIVIVLGTGSSGTVLPLLLEKLPAYGVSRRTTGLVLPSGYIFNLSGACIYISMAVIFLANAYNMDLSFGQIATIFGVMLVVTKGVATVAGGSFIVFTTVVAATGILPLEGLPLMFGVYRLMGPANATANAIHNAVATVVIAKICGEYDPARRVPAQALET